MRDSSGMDRPRDLGPYPGMRDSAGDRGSYGPRDVAGDRGSYGPRDIAGDRGSYGPRDAAYPQSTYNQRDANYHEAYNARYGIRDQSDQKEPSLVERFKDSTGYGQHRGYPEQETGAGI